MPTAPLPARGHPPCRLPRAGASTWDDARMRLSQLHIHPLKSGAILPVERARVEPWGLAGDRRWMVVDADGALLSAREERALFTVHASTTEAGDTLTLEAPGPPRRRRGGRLAGPGARTSGAAPGVVRRPDPPLPQPGVRPAG